jgi:two-component system, NtrC family, nitrogen regulation response regulator GlnG
MTFHESRTQAMAPDNRRSGRVVALRVVDTGKEHRLVKANRRWVIGSKEACDIVIKDDPYVSQVHCVIERRESGLVVRDKRSRNGTRVDGNMVEGAELRVGSLLTIGRTTLMAVAAPGTEHGSALAAMRGHDPAFRSTIAQAMKAAATDCSVLIVGETGTGKDLLARAVHEASRRALGKFVAVNCGGIPRELIGSELFGHEKGAFTGAHTERDGYFVEAHGGTLFLDEIGELPVEQQPHLLRAIETRQVRRLGGSVERGVDVRIIAATNRLEGIGTESSRLRLDLYHRLATVVLVLPPLRERMGDLMDLVNGMLEEHAVNQGLPIKSVTAEAWEVLASYAWPGNVRELAHAVSRAMALGGETLTTADFFPEIRTGRPIRGGMELVMHPDGRMVPYEAMMRGAMEQALQTHGTIRAAAEQLGMAKSTFADRARAWGLLPQGGRIKKKKMLALPAAGGTSGSGSGSGSAG